MGRRACWKFRGNILRRKRRIRYARKWRASCNIVGLTNASPSISRGTTCYGAGFPEQFVSIQRMQDAGLYCDEKSLALASSQKNPKFVDVAANMRRLSGSCAWAVRQDVLVAENADGPMGGDGNQEARVTYKKAKIQEAGQKRREGVTKVSGGKEKGEGQTLNGFNRRAGLRNR